MSEMQLDFICRMKLLGTWTQTEALEFCKRYLEADYEDEFYFDVQDNFSFSLFGDRLYLNYHFDSYDPYDIDIDITEQTAEKVMGETIRKFDEDLRCRICAVKYKILYFYNGGCAGVSEVE
jgi:hypothetical protein